MNYRNYSIQSCLQVRIFITFYFIIFLLSLECTHFNYEGAGYLRRLKDSYTTTTKIIISKLFQKSTLGTPDFRVSNISLLIWIKALKPFLKDSVLAVLFGWGQYAYPRGAIKQRRRRQRQGERQKSNSFRLAKQKLCTCITLFLYISLPSLHDYDVKLPSFTFNEGRERQDKDFLFLFLNFDTVEESTPEEFPTIKEIV